VIATLHIEKLERGMYVAHAVVRGAEMPGGESYPSIGDAMRAAAAASLPGLAHFVEVRYAGVSTGTVTVTELHGRADELAARMVAVVAEMHLLAESEPAL
jgi:hypothetical protein